MSIVSLAKLNLRFNNRTAIWEVNVEIGQRIKQLRVMKGLTQEELEAFHPVLLAESCADLTDRLLAARV